jgi:cytochrome oxidase assembly protein ShyY1
VLRDVLWTLRRPRYAALTAFMLVLALVCIAAGTFEVTRFRQKVHENAALRHNAHAAAAPLTTALVPLVGDGAAPAATAIRYRTVTASGTYVTGSTQLVRNQSLDDKAGYYVLSPLRTATGVLLVVRGFITQGGDGQAPASVPAPPAGTVQITGRLQTASSESRGSGHPSGEIDAINPRAQAARLAAPVFDAYLSLSAHQPGTSGLTALPGPSLANPTGGAVGPQLFSYILQWYLFALLALAAPFAVARHEVKEARRRFLGYDPGERELGLEPAGDLDATPQLTAGPGGASADTGGELVARERGVLAHPAGPTPEQWQRAAHLADRYGRTLGRGHDVDGTLAPVRRRGPRRAPAVGLGSAPPDSSSTPHRSADAYHGTYNDYLWELAMADGDLPDVGDARDTDAGDVKPRVDISPRVIGLPAPGADPTLQFSTVRSPVEADQQRGDGNLQQHGGEPSGADQAVTDEAPDNRADPAEQDRA